MRAAAVLQALGSLVPVRATVLAPGARPRVWPAGADALTEAWIIEPTDVGVVQTDDVTVDLDATRRDVERWLAGFDEAVEREERRLAGSFDLVIGDVPPLPFEAAYRARIPAVAVANFTWDWIYGELGFDEAAARSAAAYARATLLLEAIPFGPMPAFPARRNVGIVARPPSRSREEARSLFGLAPSDHAVLIAFQPGFAASLVIPPPSPGRRWFVPQGWPATDRTDVVPLDAARTFEDALAAADVVVGKPGYGLISDVEKAGARFLYVPRPGFPENFVLERHLESRHGSASLPATALADAGWESELARLEACERPVAEPADGAARAARAIAELLGVEPAERNG